ncbi:hypothetical protein Goshw_022989 [Gossypium schwendimanii]|uniref:Uncharacterized protein n=1 Tax=Gossypium schwendimanii TaxID=34291 RepID=A0A7J9MZI0_GOSSC|nr:hypothetical protein [Gossypium schwendimanii]
MMQFQIYLTGLTKGVRPFQQFWLKLSDL